MKHFKYWSQILPIIIAITIYGCGGSSSGEASNEAKSENTESIEKTPDILTPMNAKDREPIDAQLLMNTWKAWEGKKVQVVGYIDLFTEKSKLYFQNVKLKVNPDDDRETIYADLIEMDTTEFDSKTLVTVEGIITGYWGFDGKYSVKMKEAKILLNNPKLPTEKILDPNNLTKPVSARALYDNYVGWVDKVVTVSGNANGVTTSTTSYGVTIRVDLVDPNAAFTKYCGVRVADSSYARSAKDAPNTTRKYRGTFRGDCFGYVCIEDAVELKD